MPHKDKDARRAYHQKRYAERRDEFRALEKARYDDNREEIRQRRLELAYKHREKNNERERKRYAVLRQEILAAYGGMCQCCGESQSAFLELDHTNNDGAAHRKLIGRGAKRFYACVKANNFPREGFQLLCANCNQGKTRNGGVCPHKSSRSFSPGQ